MTVLELRSPAAGGAFSERSRATLQAYEADNAATLIAMSDEVMYLAVQSDQLDSRLDLPADSCVQVHLHVGQVVITLVGEGLKQSTVLARLSAWFKQRPAIVLPQNESCVIRMVVPQEDLSAWLDILQRIFFGNVDPAVFAPVIPRSQEQKVTTPAAVRFTREPRVLTTQARRFAFPSQLVIDPSIDRSTNKQRALRSRATMSSCPMSDWPPTRCSSAHKESSCS